MGRHLKELTGGNAFVAVLSWQPGYDNLAERYRGLTEIVKTYPGIRFIELAYDDYDSLTVFNRLNQINAQYPQVDTLVCIEGTGGQAIGNYFTKDTKKFRHILAFDNMEQTLKGLRNGTIDGVEAQEPYQMGFMAVKDIAGNVAGDTQTSRSVYTSIRWLTAENADQQEQAYDE
jgi:ribose transport system substrate-binding protein